jgi:hypothetical protein
MIRTLKILTDVLPYKMNFHTRCTSIQRKEKKITWALVSEQAQKKVFEN